MRSRPNHPSRRVSVLLLATAVLTLAVWLPSRFAAAQDDAVVGDYAVTLTYSDIPTDLVNGSMAIGHWRVTFAKDGTFVEERLDLGVLVTGSYELTGDSLTVTDEGGLLSCGNADAAPAGDGDVSTATYGYALDSHNLTLTPKDEPCPLRRALFSTRAFTFFVACLTAQSNAIGTPTVATPAATPVRTGIDALKEIGDEEASPRAGGAQPVTGVANQIDTLLGQLTACWATGDPARFLPLLSNDFQGQFLNGSEQQNLDALNSLKAAMQVPITWERAGDIESTSEVKAQAVVRTTAADQEEFVRYIFVREDDGTWRWDGSVQ